MKIAVLGSAPSSIQKAPFGDMSWEIWACSPGAYPHCSRVNEFYEVHRWEPGVVGKPATQKPWFSPEYVQWLKMQPRVWVADPDAMRDLPNAAMLPWQQLVDRYGHYVWTSSIAYMSAMAIDKVIVARSQRPADSTETDCVGFFGVDMAANEELYSGQRSACQFFLQVLVGLKIDFYIPPESDLAVPPPMYGVSETTHRAIKLLERRRELESRVASFQAQAAHAKDSLLFFQGALDDLDYIQKMWMHEGDSLAFDFEKVFPELVAGRAALKEAKVVKPVAGPVVEAQAETAAEEAASPVPSRRRRGNGDASTLKS